MIAALYVDPRGCYAGLPDVDLWDERRDARLYDGPHSVVAHPPCSRWCRLSGLVEARWGYKRGDDGGCFAAALASVRRWGGVLEHPAWSDAWAAHGIYSPPTCAGLDPRRRGRRVDLLRRARALRAPGEEGDVVVCARRPAGVAAHASMGARCGSALRCAGVVVWKSCAGAGRAHVQAGPAGAGRRAPAPRQAGGIGDAARVPRPADRDRRARGGFTSMTSVKKNNVTRYTGGVMVRARAVLAEGSMSNVIEVDGKRYYQTDDGPLPSVHVVLEATAGERIGLQIYRDRVGEDAADFARDVAARRGQAAEAAVAAYLLGGVEPAADDPIRPFWDSLADEVRKLRDDAEPGTLELQVQVASSIDRYAGTLDVRYRSRQDGRRKIVDWKTAAPRDRKTGKTKTKSRRDMADQLAQVAAYVDADAEQTGERADGRVILGIPERPARTYDVGDDSMSEWRERIARFWASGSHDETAGDPGEEQ